MMWAVWGGLGEGEAGRLCAPFHRLPPLSFNTHNLRDVSQSPFFIDGERRGRTSVQEEIERALLPAMRADSLRFITAGREDLDVRMLGGGRPFVCEVLNARAEAPGAGVLAAVEAAVNGAGSGVGVRRLALVGKAALAAIKEGEAAKQKSYEALCELPVPVTPAALAALTGTRELLLKQTTPTRVERRRAMLVRERTVHEMEATAVEGEPHLLTLRLRTQAGLYIKEFVHGDGGRTVPSLADVLGLGEPAKILSLDVLQVHMDCI